MSPSALAERVIDATGYRCALAQADSAEADARLENIRELVGSLAEYEREAFAGGDPPTLSGYLERVALVSDTDSFSEELRVPMMTVHSAKGLEFAVVLVTGSSGPCFRTKQNAGPRRPRRGASARVCCVHEGTRSALRDPHSHAIHFPERRGTTAQASFFKTRRRMLWSTRRPVATNASATWAQEFGSVNPVPRCHRGATTQRGRPPILKLALNPAHAMWSAIHRANRCCAGVPCRNQGHPLQLRRGKDSRARFHVQRSSRGLCHVSRSRRKEDT